MDIFVNRAEELKLVEEALDILQDPQRLLRTPLIEFWGIEGMGKSSLLAKIQERCQHKQLTCLHATLERQSSEQVLVQTRKQLELQRPLVLLLDALEWLESEQQEKLEVGLGELSEDSHLFVVLSSRKVERFGGTRALARKLHAYPLGPLDPASSRAYVEQVAGERGQEWWEVVYEWTQGYPLAMKVMLETLMAKPWELDNPEQQKQLIARVLERVIEGYVLRGVADVTWYRTMLSLLSVPRRFNLVIIQELIEGFAAPDYHLKSRLAYMAIPAQLNEQTQLLDWDVSKGGYAIEGVIRHLFLQHLRLRRPENYRKLHQRLAEVNLGLMRQVHGSDRLRYLREYWYHAVSSGQALKQEELAREIEALFAEEYKQDQELQQTLGDPTNRQVRSLIERHLAEKYQQLPKKII